MKSKPTEGPARWGSKQGLNRVCTLVRVCMLLSIQFHGIIYGGTTSRLPAEEWLREAERHELVLALISSTFTTNVLPANARDALVLGATQDARPQLIELLKLHESISELRREGMRLATSAAEKEAAGIKSKETSRLRSLELREEAKIFLKDAEIAMAKLKASEAERDVAARVLATKTVESFRILSTRRPSVDQKFDAAVNKIALRAVAHLADISIKVGSMKGFLEAIPAFRFAEASFTECEQKSINALIKAAEDVDQLLELTTPNAVAAAERDLEQAFDASRTSKQKDDAVTRHLVWSQKLKAVESSPELLLKAVSQIRLCVPQTQRIEAKTE